MQISDKYCKIRMSKRRDGYFMSVNTNNIYGEISITDDAIANFVYYTSLECYGIVELVPYSILDSVTALFTRKNTVKGVRRRSYFYRRSRNRQTRRIDQSRGGIAERIRQISGGEIHRHAGGHRQREYQRRKTLRAEKRGLPIGGLTALFWCLKTIETELNEEVYNAEND